MHGVNAHEHEMAHINAVKAHKVGRSILERVQIKLRQASYLGPGGSNLRKFFEQHDEDHNGVLSYEEFRRAVKRRCPLSEHELHVVFRVFDKDHNGVVDYHEFVTEIEQGHAKRAAEHSHHGQHQPRRRGP